MEEDDKFYDCALSDMAALQRTAVRLPRVRAISQLVGYLMWFLLAIWEDLWLGFLERILGFNILQKPH